MLLAVILGSLAVVGLFINGRKKSYLLPKEEHQKRDWKENLDSVTTVGFVMMALAFVSPVPLYLQITIFFFGLATFIWAVNRNAPQKIEHRSAVENPRTSQGERSNIQARGYFVHMWLIIFLVIVATTVGFWWYQLRPASIRSECSWTTATYDNSLVVSASENQYQNCLRHHGI